MKFKTLLLHTRGFIGLYLTIVVLALALGMIASISFAVFTQQKVIQNLVQSTQAHYASESGVEDAIYRLKNSMNIPANYTFPVGIGLADVTVDSSIPNEKTISVKGNSNERYRSIGVKLWTSETEADFFYGIQLGNGGLVSINKDVVIKGNLYSNGNIDGGGYLTVEGDAIAAGGSYISGATTTVDAWATTLTDLVVGGNATATTIDDTVIDGDARADSLSDCTVGGDAFYNSISGCTVGGDSTTPITPPSDPPLAGWPISDANIATWKAEAQAAGIIDGGGDVTINSNDSLGPGKITGNLDVGSNVTLTLMGTVWVEGTVDVGNDSTIKLDEAYGSSSGVFLSDGAMHYGDNVLIKGSSDPDSFIMLVVLAVCSHLSLDDTSCTHHQSALDYHNSPNVEGIIFVPNGKLHLHQNATVYQLTAYSLDIDKESTIEYDAGLADINFSSGPGGGWRVESWKEIP